MMRKIIEIDESRCNGCGLCSDACHEGAIGIVDGKAKLLRDDFCDGLGDCLPACPTGAITFVEREAQEYNEAAVRGNQAKASEPCGCPGSNAHIIKRAAAGVQAASVGSASGEFADVRAIGVRAAAGVPVADARAVGGRPADAQPVDTRVVDARAVSMGSAGGMPAGVRATDVVSAGGRPVGREPVELYRGASELYNWPVQIKLVPVNAAYFDGANLLVAADCSAYARAGFHTEFMRGKVTLIGCPKLDGVDYTEKLFQIISSNNIKSLTVVRMEVPCCGGIEHASVTALKNSGKFIPWRVVTLGTDGEILD